MLIHAFLNRVHVQIHVNREQNKKSKECYLNAIPTFKQLIALFGFFKGALYHPQRRFFALHHRQIRFIIRAQFKKDINTILSKFYVCWIKPMAFTYEKDIQVHPYAEVAHGFNYKKYIYKIKFICLRKPMNSVTKKYI